MAHFSFTMRLKRPENFETCCCETMVTPRLLPVVKIDFSGLKSVTPCWFAESIRLFSAGVTLTTILPPCSTFSAAASSCP